MSYLLSFEPLAGFAPTYPRYKLGASLSMLKGHFDEVGGFEPPFYGSEPYVLPLDDTSIVRGEGFEPSS